MSYTPAGEGWRIALGACVATVQITIFAIAYYITRHHYDKAPFLIQSKFLAQLQILGTCSTLMTPLIDMTGEAWTPCPMLVICAGLLGSATAIPLQLQMLHIVGLLSFEEQKTRLRVGKVKLTDEQIRSLQAAKTFYSTRRMQIRAGIANVFYWTVFIIIAFTDPHYKSGYGCRIQPALWEHQTDPHRDGRLDGVILAWLVLIAVGTPFSSWITFRLIQLKRADVKDSLHLARTNTLYISIIIGATLVMIGVIWFDYSEYMTVWTPYYIYSAAATLVLILHIVWPFVQTTDRYHDICKWCRRHLLRQPISPLNELVTLDSCLNDKLGYNYLLRFCKGELNEENVLILSWLTEYRRNPTVSTLLDIYDTFIHDGAPLLVNLPASLTNQVTQRIAQVSAQATGIEIVNVFCGVDQVITQLLTNNSWRRFKESKHFVAYLRRDPLTVDPKMHDASSEVSVFGSTTVTPRHMLSVQTAPFSFDTTTIPVGRNTTGLELDLRLIQRSTDVMQSNDGYTSTRQTPSVASMTPGSVHQPSYEHLMSRSNRGTLENAARLHKLTNRPSHSKRPSYSTPTKVSADTETTITFAQDYSKASIIRHKPAHLTIRLPEPVPELRSQHAFFVTPEQAAAQEATNIQMTG